MKKIKKIRRFIINLLFKFNFFFIIKIIYSVENLFMNKKGYKPKKYLVINIDEFNSIDKIDYIYNITLKNLPLYKPEYYNKCSDQLKTFNNQKVFSIMLNNVAIIGEKPGFFKNNYFIYNLARNDFENRYNLGFHELRNINRKNAIINVINENNKINKGISLVGFAPGNYYHFVIELVSRLFYLDKEHLYLDYPLLIDQKVSEIKQFCELIEVVNINDRNIIYVDKDKLYRIDHLIYPSYVNWLPINVKKRESKEVDFVLYKDPILYIRNIALNKYSISNSANAETIIYVSRKNAINARLANEILVLKLMKKLGVTIVYPEELTFEEQVKTFNKSKIIIGTSGAALTNIIFANKKSTLVTIIPEEYKFYGYSNLAFILGIQTIFIDAKITKSETEISRETYEVNINELEQLLQELI